MATPARSALLVVVPELEPVVGIHREVLDPSTAAGIPAHVTVLYPFLAPADIDDATLATLRSLVGRTSAFACTFDRLEWFDDGLLVALPDRDDPFRELTAAVTAAFPDHPPYGGRYGDPVPHATIGYPDTPVAERERAHALVEPDLPVRARVEHVSLLVGDDVPNGWSTLAQLPLAPDRP